MAGGSEPERAQTNLDFAIGVSILLVTIIAAMTFIPSLFASVDQGNADADEVAATRIAASLTEGKLSDPARPNALDLDCTRALFGGDAGPCGLAGGPMRANVSFSNRRYVNVTFRHANSSEILCYDDGNDELTTGSCGGVQLAGGGNTTASSDIAYVRRAVRIEDTYAKLVVKVW